MKRLGNDVNIMHDPVDTETDQPFLTFGLDVDVTGMLFKGIV